jgi:hypothetical protein
MHSYSKICECKLLDHVSEKDFFLEKDYKGDTFVFLLYIHLTNWGAKSILMDQTESFITFWVQE